MVISGGQPNQASTRTVVVSGDVTMDWNLARESLMPGGHASDGTRASWQRGGAALLADLVTAVAATMEAPIGPVRVSAVDAPTQPVPPGDDHRNHSYSVWSRVALEGDSGRNGEAWRVMSALGVDRARTDDAVQAEWRRLRDALPGADVAVLDDAALGFRDLSDAELWRALEVPRPWVILKQSRPVAQGPLWEHLLAVAADRLIVVLSIDDLRGREVQVSRALSWERTAQDLLWELVNKPDVNVLSRIAHTVISFGPAGAALVSRSPDPAQGPICTLHFDPESVEAAWDTGLVGSVMGGTDCLTAALVREVLLDPAQPKLDRGIGAGIAAARRLHRDGYEERGPGRLELGFPLASVVEELTAGRAPLQAVAVPDPTEATGYWTILADRCTGDLAAKAAEITREGPEQALAGVPLGRFANLVTADRSEIEAFHSVAALIGEYAQDPRPGPLSIGVFGPPGSGKSFGVKQVSRAVADGRVSEPIEFNLAQLRSPDDLIDAFHLVRDKALSGQIPLVFWDEFDTTLQGQPLGWLRYFLAPMQDGEFRQGQITHPIGASIFVFAGGTCARVEDFGRTLDEETFRQAKGPDFASRLKGFVDVLGPNPQGTDDPYYVIRRAILLRSILRRNAPQLFDGDRLRIDGGVLRAFLETTEFQHGARSLEAVVATSHLTGSSVYERSSLPPAPQLDLHVDAQDFLALVQRPDLEGPLLERLAEAAHQVYEAGLHEAGDGPRPVYDELSEFQKAENRGNVRDIPAKLALVGCVMVPASVEPVPAVLTDDEIDALAREEHERWLRDLGPGWRHGTPTDKARKLHEAYLPWDELPQDQRDKDRTLVRELPTILHRAGYAMVRTAAPGRKPTSKDRRSPDVEGQAG